MKTSKSMVLSCIFAVLALPLVGAVGDASAQNLLVNPGFETGDLTGWLVFGQSANSDVTVQSPDNGPSLPGMHSYDLKLDQADIGGVLFVEIFAEVAGGGVIGGSGLMGPLWPWNDWAFFGGSFEAPASTDFLTIQIMANTGAAIGTNCLAHVDNVYLSQEGPPVATESKNWGGIKALYR